MQMQLEEIMKEACEGHTAVLDANKRTKSGALESGAALLRAKALVPHGEWEECLKKHFNGSKRTAQRYMQVAREVANGSIDPDDYETLFHMEQAVAQSHDDDEFDLGFEIVVLVQIALDAIHMALVEVEGADRAERVEAFQKRLAIYTEDQS